MPQRAMRTQQQLDESFDAFYRCTRRQLLIEAFALTGDRYAARSAVREGYGAAARRWRRVSRLTDPLAWVRPKVWRQAQRLHADHGRHRPRRLAPEQRRVLRALAQLPGAQRRLLVAVDVAGLDLSAAASERLGLPVESVDALLRRARGTLQETLDDGALSPTVLHVLDDMLDPVRLQRGSRLRRSGRRRRRRTLVAVAAVTSLLVVGGGTFAHEPRGTASAFHPAPSATPGTSSELPTRDDLLDATQVRRLAPARGWRTVGTTNNTSGDGLSSACQRARFADPHGSAALVRTFRTPGSTPHAVQTVEASRSAAAGGRTFDTTLGWYAGCRAPRVQVAGAYTVRGVGDDATVLVLRDWRSSTTISVGVARTGSLVTSTLVTTAGTRGPSPRRLTGLLAESVSPLCARAGHAGCVSRPSVRAVPPPPSGEGRGLLAVDDLPPVGDITQPWTGTEPVSPRSNTGATTCDEARFASSGARQRRSRTYLAPRAHVPARFGLTESYGRFASPRAAARFLAQIRSHVAGCAKRDLAAEVGRTRTWRAQHADLSRWDLVLAVSAHQKVRMRIAFVRVGDTVAQLTFVPADHGDIVPRGFDAMMLRAGQRLREL